MFQGSNEDDTWPFKLIPGGLVTGILWSGGNLVSAFLVIKNLGLSIGFVTQCVIVNVFAYLQSRLGLFGLNKSGTLESDIGIVICMISVSLFLAIDPRGASDNTIKKMIEKEYKGADDDDVAHPYYALEGNKQEFEVRIAENAAEHIETVEDAKKNQGKDNRNEDVVDEDEDDEEDGEFTTTPQIFGGVATPAAIFERPYHRGVASFLKYPRNRRFIRQRSRTLGGIPSPQMTQSYVMHRSEDDSVENETREPRAIPRRRTRSSSHDNTRSSSASLSLNFPASLGGKAPSIIPPAANSLARSVARRRSSVSTDASRASSPMSSFVSVSSDEEMKFTSSADNTDSNVINRDGDVSQRRLSATQDVSEVVDNPKFSRQSRPSLLRGTVGLALYTVLNGMQLTPMVLWQEKRSDSDSGTNNTSIPFFFSVNVGQMLFATTVLILYTFYRKVVLRRPLRYSRKFIMPAVFCGVLWYFGATSQYVAISLGGYNPQYTIINLVSIVISTLVAVLWYKEAPGVRNKVILFISILLIATGVSLLAVASN